MHITHDSGRWRVSRRRETYPSHSAGAVAYRCCGRCTYTHGRARERAREIERGRETERREKRTRAENASGDDDGGVDGGNGVVVWRSGRMHRVPRRSSRHVSRSVAAGRGRRRRSRSCIPRWRLVADGGSAAGCFSSSSELAPRVRLLLMGARSSALSSRAVRRGYGRPHRSDGDDEFRSTFGGASLFLSSHSTVRHARS